MSTSLSPPDETRAQLLRDVAALPSLPGVYRYFDAQDQVLYVGKAISLKKRVSSYFQRQKDGTRIGHMVSQIARVETTVVRSEAEALILESNLIKALEPRYNILFRDDKSYPYLKITGLAQAEGEIPHRPADAFPRVAYYRGAVDRKHRYFGPYPSAWAVKETIELLQKVFRLRTCEDSVFANRSRPCLLYQIKRCSGPCVQHISTQDYAADVTHAEQFLKGDQQQVVHDLQAKMMECSNTLQFEQAADIRNQLQALSKVLHQQGVEDNSLGAVQDADILAACVQGGRACVNLGVVRGGRHLGDRPYFPTQVESAQWLDAVDEEAAHEQTDASKLTKPEDTQPTDHQDQDLRKAAPTERIDDTAPTYGQEITTTLEPLCLSPEDLCQKVLQAFIAQHYLSAPPPPLLIVSHAVDPSLLDALSESSNTKVTAQHQPRDARRAWLDICATNAQLKLTQLLAEEGSQKARTRALIDVLDLAVEDPETFRIECFDISHTAGEATQASCVVFENHCMQNGQYRRFNIDGITAGDDYAAMRQVLMRRYAKAVETVERGQGKLPDLVLVDGGKGQVSVAREVFEELGIALSRIVGVEKGEGRKVGLEELIFADGREKLTLSLASSALLLVAQIRDEAHRFAITGMRARRASVRMGGGQLEDIPGIGPKKRSKLLQRFGGVRGVAQASVEDLMTVEGISKTLAQEIYRALR